MLILCALVIGIGRELVKEVGRFHQPLETWLSDQTALSVHFQKVRGSWDQTSPELRFYHVQISNPAFPEESPASVAQLRVRLSLGHSLLNLAPRFRVRISGAEVRLRKQAEKFSVLGMALGSTSGAAKKNPITSLLLNRPRISVYDSRLIIDGLYDRRTDAHISNFKLFWENQRALLDGEMMVRGQDELKLAVKGDLFVLSRNGGEIQGVTYLSLSEGQLARWVPPALAERLPISVQGVRGSTEIWLNWFNNALLSSTLRIDWHDVRLQTHQQNPVALKRMAGTARWQGRMNEFWQLGMRNLTLESDAGTWRPATLQINALHEEAANRWRYEFGFADASLDVGLQPLLDVIPNSSALREALVSMQPTGRVQDVMVKAIHEESGWKLEKAQAVLRDYAQKPWGHFPGLQHAGAALWYENDALWVDFNEQDVILDYPAMFRSPLTLTRLQGSFLARRDKDAWRIRSSPVQVVTAHGSAFTRMTLALPRKSVQAPGAMALQVTLRDFKAQDASIYLPAGVIPEKLLAWLDSALKGGRLNWGDILFHGPLRKPEQENGRSILLGFQVEEGQLQFLPEWQEPIYKLKGDVIVENGQVQAIAEGGEYFGLKLGASRIWTERVGDIPHLHVQTQGQGEAANGLRLLRESPLGKTLKDPLSDMEIKGPLSVDFALDAPLLPKALLAGKTVVNIKGGELNWPSQRLTVNKLEMALGYDLQKGLSTQKLQGAFLNGVVAGKLYQQQEQGLRILRLDLRGKSDMDTVREWLNLPQLALANGSIPYDLQLFIRPAKSRLQSLLQLRSSLKGVAIDLPPPLGKAADTEQPLLLHYSLGGEKRIHRMTYADQVAVVWETQSGRWQRTGVHLGKGDAQLSAQHSWRLTGALTEVRWNDWVPVLDKVKATASGTRGAGASWLANFGDSSLVVDHLFLGEDDLQQVTLGLQSDIHYVTVTASGNRLQGRLTLPRTYLDSPSARSIDTPVSVYLQKLVLEGKPQLEGKPEQAIPADPLLDLLPPATTLDPRLLPAAHLRIDQLLAGDDDRGRYSMTLTPLPEGVVAENLRFTLKYVDFTGTARWEQRGTEAFTTFKGKGVAGNVADVLTAWGYTPSLDSESAAMDMDVRWQGAPYQFKLARTEGNLQAQLKNGHFLKVGNNAAGRVWGLLNFETWMSRLQLRFNDLSDNEMTFSDIHGRFALHNNQVQVRRLKINSASLKMKMDGLLDMSERQLNMQWYVTVPVTRNLLLPAAVVGGIPGAATAYVIDKILSSQIDKLTTLTYDVKGTFDQPEATLRIPLR